MTINVLSSFTDPRLGGPQHRSLDVAIELRQFGIETEFLIPFGEDSFADLAYSNGFDVHRIPLYRPRPPSLIKENIKYILKFKPTIDTIKSVINRNDIDVVHANMVVNFQTALATAQTDTPLAWHFNDTSTPTPIKEIAAKLGVYCADEIVVAADAVHEYYFDSKRDSRTIYAPVDIDEFNPTTTTIEERDLREELGLQPDIPVIGTIGNLNPIKGHKYFLQAIAQLVGDDREVAVPIVGSKLDSRKKYFKRLHDLRSELGLEKKVKFVGFRSDIPELLSLFDVFVLPSIAEACPIVVLEAMAMKCPVVATDVGGVPEEIPDSNHGWVVPPKDCKALARAIAEALEDPEECRRRAANARKRVESVFSLEACVDRHEELYRSLVEKN